MSTEKSIKLLWDCANTLSGETHTHKLLKSHYINTSRKIARHKTVLPEEHYGISKMCPRCSSQWSNNDYELHLKPQRVQCTAKVKKLLAKFDEANTKQEKGLLTPSQRKRAKWLKKRISSNMEIKCAFCQHKSLIPLEKPKKRLKKTESKQLEVSLVEPIVPDNQKVKKKKKPKDKNAGLKIPSVTKSPTVTNCPKTPNPINAPISPKPATTTTTVKQQTNKNIKTLPPTTAKVINKTTLTATTKSNVAAKGANSTTQQPMTKNTSKNKKKQKQNQNQQKPQKPAPQPLKVKSKTQKQNSLLQIAKLIKMEGTKTAQNSVQARLQALLRENNS